MFVMGPSSREELDIASEALVSRSSPGGAEREIEAEPGLFALYRSCIEIVTKDGVELWPRDAATSSVPNRSAFELEVPVPV